MAHVRRLPRFALSASVLVFIGAPARGVAADAAPTATQVGSWVRAQAHPIRTVEAADATSDLEPLRHMIGDARVVALGETTHGSREVFQMKDRLVRFLVAEMGFSLFAIEANMPEAARVNEYVAAGAGNSSDHIRDMRFWTWQTEEVREMVEWMRRFNQQERARDGDHSIAFTGFDMQEPSTAASSVREYVARNLPALADAAETAVRQLTAARTAATGFANGTLPVEHLRGRRLVISTWIKTADIPDHGWAGLWCSATTRDGAPPAFKNTQATAPRGTTRWTRYELSMDVPAGAHTVMFGLMLQGAGQAWFDDLAFTVDGKSVAPEGIDAGFEGASIDGFPMRSENAYTVTLVPEARTGRQALRIAGSGSQTGSSAGQTWTALAGELEAHALASPDSATRRARVWIAQQAQLVAQWCAVRDSTLTRDEAMAKNVLWLLAQDSTARVILWAHNGHVARRPDAMGGVLERELRDDLFVIGFATGRGEYRAVVRGAPHPSTATLQRPPADSVEAALAAAGMPRLLLDLRPCRTEADPRARWFLTARPHRKIGWGVIATQFKPRAAATDYDAILWIDRTTATVPFP